MHTLDQSLSPFACACRWCQTEARRRAQPLEHVCDFGLKSVRHLRNCPNNFLPTLLGKPETPGFGLPGESDHFVGAGIL